MFRDGTGPNGEGSLTGRGLGNCTTGGAAVNYGYGRGAGRGCGAGVGFGRGFRRGYSVGVAPANYPVNPQNSKEYLEARKNNLEKDLENIKSELERLD